MLINPFVFAGAGGGNGFHDAFNGTADVLLSAHTPDVAPSGFVWADTEGTLPELSGSGSIRPSSTGLSEYVAVGDSTGTWTPMVETTSGYTLTMVATLVDSNVIEGSAFVFLQNADATINVGIALFDTSVTVTGVDGNTDPINSSVGITPLVAGVPHTLELTVTATGWTLDYDTVQVLSDATAPGLNFAVAYVLLTISADGVGAGLGNSEFSMQDVLLTPT